VGKSALLLVLACLALVQEGGAATERATYLPVDMRFLDVEHGFVQLQPVIACGSCPDRIQRTDDGGKTWRATSLRHIPLPNAERRFRASWRSGTKRRLQLATVVAPTVAWATSQPETGRGSRLFLSRDGGDSWQRLRLPCGRPFAFYRPLVAAVSARRGWVLCLGEPGAGQQNKALYETLDASLWTLRRDLSSSGYGQRLAFSQTGFGLLAESRGGLLVTRDSGRSWRMPRITSPEEAEAQAIAVFPPGRGLVLVRDDRSRRRVELYTTPDAGRRWSLLHVWK
jgi:photosystem II stability/assembly factor-like uncharacterized protein